MHPTEGINAEKLLRRGGRPQMNKATSLAEADLRFVPDYALGNVSNQVTASRLPPSSTTQRPGLATINAGLLILQQKPRQRPPTTIISIN